MSRSYRHYKFRDSSGNVFNDFVASENASDRMARRTLCHRLAKGEDVEYYTTYKRRYYMRFDVWWCNCEYPKGYHGEYPKGYHGNGFENYESILNIRSFKVRETESIRSDGSWCSEREIDEMAKNLPPDDKAYLMRKIRWLYKK